MKRRNFLLAIPVGVFSTSAFAIARPRQAARKSIAVIAFGTAGIKAAQLIDEELRSRRAVLAGVS